jgi:hypothetical protein
MNTIAEALVALVALTAFLLFFYGPWQRAVEDLARQIIFERRAQLFALAQSGRLSFESDSYKMSRLMLNAYIIRYAHDISWPRILFQKIFFSKSSKFSTQLVSAINKIEDNNTALAVKLLLSESSLALAYLIGLKSIFLFPIFTIMLLAKPYSVSVKSFIDREIKHGRSVTEKVSLTMQTSAAEEYEAELLAA